jgi:acetolactate synthase small subunit
MPHQNHDDCDQNRKSTTEEDKHSLNALLHEATVALNTKQGISDEIANEISGTDALSGQIVQLQYKLDLESKSRVEIETKMLARISQLESERICERERISQLESERICERERISQLESERICERELMLVRALATSFQYALTQKFPGLFTTLFPYSCTFNDISKKVSKQSNDTFNTTLEEVTNVFISHGTDAEDINDLINIIRELGTSSSHVTKLIDGKPSAADLLEIINHSPLPPNIKIAARTLLDALVFIVPPGKDLLYCAVTSS